ncbi:MAG TPA: hypothetical protein QF764_06300 [Planctomycetota bacterium]|nr:hypothetical protein [Planctomycetota bacterium]
MEQVGTTLWPELKFFVACRAVLVASFVMLAATAVMLEFVLAMGTVVFAVALAMVITVALAVVITVALAVVIAVALAVVIAVALAVVIAVALAVVLAVALAMVIAVALAMVTAVALAVVIAALVVVFGVVIPMYFMGPTVRKSLHQHLVHMLEGTRFHHLSETLGHGAATFEPVVMAVPCVALGIAAIALAMGAVTSTFGAFTNDPALGTVAFDTKFLIHAISTLSLVEDSPALEEAVTPLAFPNTTQQAAKVQASLDQVLDVHVLAVDRRPNIDADVTGVPATVSP